MLPPVRPVSPVDIGAEPKPGASAKPPSIGRSGTAKSFNAPFAPSGRAVPALRSSVQRTGLPRSPARLTRLLPSARPTMVSRLSAQSRLGVSFSRCTTSVSPGSAPLTKNGPVCGLPNSARVTPCSSTPPESMVRVCTVSPGQIVSTGARSAVKRLEKSLGSWTCACAPPAGGSGSSRATKRWRRRTPAWLESGQSASPARWLPSTRAS